MASRPHSDLRERCERLIALGSHAAQWGPAYEAGQTWAKDCLGLLEQFETQRTALERIESFAASFTDRHTGFVHIRRMAAAELLASNPASSPDGPEYDERTSELDVAGAEAGWTGAPDPASESGVTGENFAARVQHAQALLECGDEVGLIAYLLDRPVEDVRRVVSSPARSPDGTKRANRSE